MSRKHYRMIADAFRSNTDPKAIAEALAISLKEDNPRFRRETFLDACGFGDQS